MPNFELRNRLRIAHEHAAGACHRAAMVHEEAAAFWEQIHEPDEAQLHFDAAERCVQMAREHEAQALTYAQPSKRRSTQLES